MPPLQKKLYFLNFYLLWKRMYLPYMNMCLTKTTQIKPPMRPMRSQTYNSKPTHRHPSICLDLDGRQWGAKQAFMWTPSYIGVDIFGTSLEGNSNGRIDTNAFKRHTEHFTACLSVVCATIKSKMGELEWFASGVSFRNGLSFWGSQRFSGSRIFTKWGSQWDAIIHPWRKHHLLGLLGGSGRLVRLSAN